MKKNLIFAVLFLAMGNSFIFSQNLILPDENNNCNIETKYNGNIITFRNPVTLTSQAQTIRIDLEFSSPTCVQVLTFINLPSWITVVTNTSNYIDLAISENQSSSIRNLTLTASTNAATSILVPISITQAAGAGCNGTNYYTDTDGDGFGDIFAFPEYSCTPITNKVTNNLDTCPNDPYPTNNGCPPVPENLNWVQSKSYDIKGNLLNSSKGYFDALGKSIQTQTYDIKDKRIWANQTLYDYAGRPALNTLSAPITDKNSDEIFQFKEGFIKKSNNTDFSVVDFENSDIYNPSTVGAQNHTLGKYYSTSNTDEVFQDKTDRPYTRTIYSELNPGKVLKTIGGNKLDGEWRQGNSYTIPASQELYYAYGYHYFKIPQDAAFDQYNMQIINLKATKTITQDINGNEYIVFTDSDGKTLATARSGIPDSPNLEKQYEVISNIDKDLGFVDIHIPKGCDGTLSFIGNINNYSVYNLKNEEQINNISSLGTGVYRIYYNYPISNGNLGLVAINTLNNTLYSTSSIAGVKYKVNYYDYSLNYYDDTGHLKSTLQPIGFNSNSLNNLSPTVSHNQNFVSTFLHNSQGQILTSTSPDEGTANFKYREDGQIRFSQNNKQLIVNEYSYTNYDELGRPIESGVSIGDFTTLNPDTSVITGTKERHFTVYDEDHNLEIATTLLNANIPNSNDEYKQSYIAGNVSKTYNRNETGLLISTTYYSYDIYGRVKWIIQKTNGLGVKTIDYVYDPVTSQVLKVIYQKNTSSEKFIHRYTYNVAQELVKVETSTDDIEYFIDADYSYYETGALKRTQIANGLQGVDYVYNLAGQLKSINHPNLTAASDPGGDATDLFGMVIDYYNGDYARSSNFSIISSGTNQFNGNIKGITSNTNWGSGTNTPSQYTYQYNSNNWLKEANFSGGNATASNDYKVHNITYDANGNIKTLNRNKNTDSSGNLMDQFTYHYQSGTSNKLDHIDDAVTTITNANDLKDQNVGNYTYNSIGQLIEDREYVTTSSPNDIIRYEYNASGLVTKVTKANLPVVEFIYNDKGFRTRKISYVNGSQSETTDYLRDASGSVLAIYQDNVLVENPIYGASRLGIYKKQAHTSLYQLTDHLGNVRAVISKKHNTRVQATDFNNGSASPWVASSSTTSMNVEDGRLKIVTKKHLNGANGYYALEANKEYVISIDIDKTDFNDAPLEFSIWKGSSKKYGTYVTENGILTANFTPDQTRTYRFNFRLRKYGYTGVDQTVFIDNVVINEKVDNGILAITHATDYYPFGMPMPNRQIINGEPYRYAYQGQEKDPETGKEAFQLRLWDSRIGRWLTTDPYGQYSSPYVGMGNDPINGIDPDGGLFGRIRAWTHKLFNGGEIFKDDFDRWKWLSDDVKVSGNNSDGYLLHEIESKNFGYGALGKIEAIGPNSFDIDTNISFGLVNFSNDKGFVGIKGKVGTVDLFSGSTSLNYNTRNGTFDIKNTANYIGKDGKIKGTLFSLNVESLKGDLSFGRNFDYNFKNNSFNSYRVASIGYPLVQAKAVHITKHGAKVKIGFQEDFGKSFSILGGQNPFLSFAAKINLKTQISFNWKF